MSPRRHLAAVKLARIVLVRLRRSVFPFHLRDGDDGIRTHDPLLAGQVLSQLSYTPMSVTHRPLYFVLFFTMNT